MARLSIGTALLLGVVACSSSSSSGGDHQPPVLSNLTVANQTTTVPVGQITQFSGTFLLADSDGDAQSLQLAVTQTPSGVAAPSAQTSPLNASGQTSATVNWAFDAAPPAAGAYTIALSVIDTEGKTSNALTFNATAK